MKRNNKMKIVAGLGSIDDYPDFVQAGADELFCGYVPLEWQQRFGFSSPINRREVMYYNVQIGAWSELMILKDMTADYHVPVTIALNALLYQPEQYPYLHEYMEKLYDHGFQSFIIADPGLLFYLRKHPINGCRIHLSGETAEINPFMAAAMKNHFDIERIIFHRKVALPAMAKVTAHMAGCEGGREMTYEAFVLNEMCHFTGAFCQSLHCDELCHSCLLPYRLGRLHLKDTMTSVVMPERMETDEIQMHHQFENLMDDGYLTGCTGCGLCALWRLREAGVTHMKLVSRGNYAEETEKDIRQLALARTILEKAENEQMYIKNMKAQLFVNDCSHQCYYRMGEMLNIEL